jgi:cobalt-zinc-cadmium efflux system membrane fusion protein
VTTPREESSIAPPLAQPTEAAPPGEWRRRLGWIAVAMALLVGVVVGALAMHREMPVAEPPRDVPHLDGPFITFSSGFAARSKIQLGTCETALLSPVVTVTGTVAFDPELVAAIGARVPGRVRRVLKFPGDPVQVGEVLAELESAELGQAQTAVLSARAHAEASTANQQREEQLAEQRVSSQRDAELAKATALAAKADLYAAEQRVRAFGGPVEGAAIGVLQLRSPIAGKVVESHVYRGQSVEPSFTAFRVADLHRVWIELQVFERELGRIQSSDKVEISPQTNASVVVSGTVAHVGDIIDLDTRSAPVRVVVDNGDGALRPGQSVLAKIHTRATPAAPGSVLLLPLEAVTSVDGRPTVFVAHGPNQVEPRPVTLGARDGTRVEVLTGLSQEDRVVVGGVFALKSEIFR